MKIADYKRIAEDILQLSFDCESFPMFERVTDIELEKCKCIIAMTEILSDVPLLRVNHVFEQKMVDWEYDGTLDDINTTLDE